MLAKRWFRWFLYVFTILFLTYLFRFPLLRASGNFLVAADKPVRTEVCFVLGGNSFERGLTAIELSKVFPGQKFVATGGNFPLQIQALNSKMYEAELTKLFMSSKGVPEADIGTLTASTSTMEESEEILSYCKEHGLKNISVLTSSFHLRRTRWVFEKKFKKEGINVSFFSSPTENFDSDNWWKYEQGLITWNNEYLKLLYYLIKY